MGGLINTKGTQRLARLFNNRFNPLNTARPWTNNIGPGTTLPAAFRNASADLLTLSDNFIAQYATPGNVTWLNNGNDLLYPSATLTVDVLPTALNPNVIGFRLPAGRAAVPGHIQPGASFRNLDNRRTFQPGTIIAAGGVSAVMGGAGGAFTVTFSLNPILANLALSDRISFGLGAHTQLVRRWRWYLAHDLLPENHAAIRSAISSALDDRDFTQIIFQTIEDTQRVFASAQRQTDNVNDEFDNTLIMYIVLLTQQTTAPDPLDPQS